MKYNLAATILISLGLSTSAFSQTFIDAFTSGYDGSVWTEVNGLGPNFDLKNPDTFTDLSGNIEDFLNYFTTSAPTGFEQVFLNYGGTAPAAPTNLQNFSVSLDASNFAGFTGQLTAGVGSLAQIGLNINDSDISDGFNLYNGAYSFGGFGSNDVIFFDGTNFAQPEDFTEQVTLLLDFSALTQTFTFSYATEVSTSGSFVSFATLNIDGTGTSGLTDFVDDWGMASGEAFDINIYAGSNVAIPSQVAGFGFMNADNFELTAPIPEPASLPVLLGLVALGFACIRRRA